MITTTSGRPFGSLRLRGRVWWLRYRIGGVAHEESSGSTSRSAAAKLLANIEARLDLGAHVAPHARNVTFANLEQLLRTHYVVAGLRSLKRAEGALAHLRDAFGGMRAVSITADRIVTYEADRLSAGAARATINFELATLRKAFNEAVRLGRLPTRPQIKTPLARNARKGFFEAEDFRALLAELPAYLQPVMLFAYSTGWRVRSEVLPLTWDRVDFAAGVVRLEPNTTKSGEGRTFPFDVLPDLAAMLTAQRVATSALERATGQIIPVVFHRGGAPIKDYYHAWDTACTRAATSKKAGATLGVLVRPQLLGRIAHDFRRTAVRNLVRAGVSERVAMDLTGHKTRSVFDRYNVTSEADLRAGISKLADFHARGHLGGQLGIRLVSGAE